MRVLVVRFSSIGDVVLTTAVVRCLKLQTNAEIHFLTKASFEEIWQHNLYVDKVWTIQKDIYELRGAFRKTHFDFVIDLHHNLRTWHLQLLMNQRALRFPKLNVSKWLSVHLHLDILPKTHIVDRFFEAVKPLGVTNDGAGLDFFFSNEEETVWQQAVLYPLNAFYVLAVGAKWNTKMMPEHLLMDIIEQVEKPIVIIGGPAEAKLGKRLSKSFPLMINYCGLLSLRQSAWLISKAAAIITPDTGMMHIAAALKKPILSVWGNTVPAFGMYPYLPKGLSFAKAEVEGLRCRPCSKIGFSKCPKGHFACMEQQSVPNMLNELSSIEKDWKNGNL